MTSTDPDARPDTDDLTARNQRQWPWVLGAIALAAAIAAGAIIGSNASTKPPHAATGATLSAGTASAAGAAGAAEGHHPEQTPANVAA